VYIYVPERVYAAVSQIVWVYKYRALSGAGIPGYAGTFKKRGKIIHEYE
jgi:hypothetical protein